MANLPKTVAVKFNREAFCNGMCAEVNNRKWANIIDWNRVYIAVASNSNRAAWDFDVAVDAHTVPANFNELTSIFHKDLWTWVRKERLRETLRGIRIDQKKNENSVKWIKRQLRKVKL